MEIQIDRLHLSGDTSVCNTSTLNSPGPTDSIQHQKQAFIRLCRRCSIDHPRASCDAYRQRQRFMGV